MDTVLDLLPSIVPGPVLLPSPLSILANLAANLSFISFSKAWQSAIEAALSASFLSCSAFLRTASFLPSYHSLKLYLHLRYRDIVLESGVDGSPSFLNNPSKNIGILLRLFKYMLWLDFISSSHSYLDYFYLIIQLQ